LIEAEDVSDRAYREIVKLLFNVDGGRTDADPTATTIQSVITQIASKKGVPAENITSNYPSILPKYENIFERCVDEGEVVVLPGVFQLLESLREDQVPFGVYTGDS